MKQIRCGLSKEQYRFGKGLTRIVKKLENVKVKR